MVTLWKNPKTFPRFIFGIFQKKYCLNEIKSWEVLPYEPKSKSILDLSKTIEWVQKIKEDKIFRYVSVTSHTQRKLLNFENWGNGKVSKIRKRKIIFWFDFYSCSQGPSKIGHHFRKPKWFKNWSFQKMTIIKNLFSELIFINEKKNQKDWNDFWHR